MLTPYMTRRITLIIALCLNIFIAAGAQAQSINLNFGNATANANANSTPGAAAYGIKFFSAELTADLDQDGYPIYDNTGNLLPGYTHWESIQDVNIKVVSPESVMFGTGPNALDARFDQVLMKFNQPFNLSSFSIIQGNSNFGNPGLSDLLFLDINGKQIGQPVSFTQYGHPSQTISFTGLVHGISSILLPAGVLYNGITIAAVPEPSSWAMILAGFLMLGVVLHRKRR